MLHPDRIHRRHFLGALSAALATPLLARCASDPALPQHPSAQRLRTSVVRAADGSITRRFAGRAAPEDLAVVDPTTGASVRIYDLFPAEHCPFAIGVDYELGPGGYALETPDRTLMGILPDEADIPWALNMVPSGVAIDGALLDPSGPWYDGGPADPNNPFDRGCSGWEYDPVFPTVADLVGVPAEVRGHVQPNGQFHYHGVPRAMLANLRLALRPEERLEALVVGYSADGHWILDSTVPSTASRSGKRLHLVSGYVLREGARTAVPHTSPALVPPGEHDGTFVQDWVYDPERKRALLDEALRVSGDYHGLRADELRSGVAELVVLDRLNGLRTDALRLPSEVPERSYVYAMTPDWPEIPRLLAHEPAASFRDIIPLSSEGGMGPPGRDQLYAACEGADIEVHTWAGRARY